jgi:ribosomal protein S18 acetylase RimI-like enzyme
MVEPRYQGRGIARQLMQVAERQAALAHFETIRLDAFSLNPQALRLYQQLGYTDVGGAPLRKGSFRCFEKRLAAPAAAP